MNELLQIYFSRHTKTRQVSKCTFFFTSIYFFLFKIYFFFKFNLILFRSHNFSLMYELVRWQLLRWMRIRTEQIKWKHTTHSANVQIFNLICVECLEWHIAISFVRYIIFLLLLSASTSSSVRRKNVWQVSVRINECEHIVGCKYVCERDIRVVCVSVCLIHIAYVRRWQRLYSRMWQWVNEEWMCACVPFIKKADSTWQKTRCQFNEGGPSNCNKIRLVVQQFWISVTIAPMRIQNPSNAMIVSGTLFSGI